MRRFKQLFHFIYQLEDEPHIENDEIYLHPLQLYSLANKFFMQSKFSMEYTLECLYLVFWQQHSLSIFW